MTKDIKAYIYSINGEIISSEVGYQVIPFKKNIPTAWRTRDGSKYGRLIELIPCKIVFNKSKINLKI